MLNLSPASQATIRAYAYIHSADAILTVDILGYMVDCNEAATLLLGYPREELLGHPVDICLPDEMREIHRQHLLGYWTDPYSRPMGLGQVLLLRQKDATLVPVLIHLSPVVVPDGRFVVTTLRRTALPA